MMKTEKLSLMQWIGIVIAILFIAFIFLSATDGLPSTTYSLPKIETVQQIAENYHSTHTYSKTDLFVCSDMATDVWNIIETKGINAQIAIGNIDDPNANFTEWNHAWILAEVDDGWIAVETTGGYLVWGENVQGENIVKNDLYYKGAFFDNPKQFKEFVDLEKQYNSEIDTINDLQLELKLCTDEAKIIEIDYNANCAGSVSYALLGYCISKQSLLSEKYGECIAKANEFKDEANSLSDTVDEMKELLT